MISNSNYGNTSRSRSSSRDSGDSGGSKSRSRSRNWRDSEDSDSSFSISSDCSNLDRGTDSEKDKHKLVRESTFEHGCKTAKKGLPNIGKGSPEQISFSGMIIEDAERLKLWLTAILQPLCDADPAALAKYVLALIKKEKPEKELRQSMSDQLDVFLQGATKTFLDRLFELLRTKEYLIKAPPPIIPKETPMMNKYEADSSVSSQDTSQSAASKCKEVPSEDMDCIMALNTTIDTIEDDPVSIVAASVKDESKEDLRNIINSSGSNKKDKKEDERDRSRRGRRSRSRSPGRRSNARLGRSRSRNRDRKYHPRKNWRRRTRSRSPGARNRSISAGRNRSRSPPRYRRHGSRSRSRSPKDTRGRSRSPQNNREKDKKEFLSTTNSENMDDGTKMTSDKPSLQSVIVKPGSVGGNRCRDFDEKGLCMRGELCPFDHGTDPVVLEDVVIPGVTNAPSQVNFNQSMAPEPYGTNPSMMRPALPSVMGEYYPDNPAMDPNVAWGGFRPRGMGYDPMLRGRGGMLQRPIGPFPPTAHRDLINVPVMGMQGPMEGHPHHPMLNMHLHPARGMHMGRGRGRGGFDHSRLGFKPARNYANCSLEVKKIPREQNNIMDLNSHFQKFGKIVNIQINFENDQEAALVTFSLPTEAQTAYRSTEAVLNNRFIRVFWHSKEKENEEATDEALRISVKDRLGGHEIDDKDETQEKILVSGNNVTKTVYSPALLAKKTDPAAEKIQAVEAIKKSQEMLAAQESLKRKQEEQKKEALKLFGELRKRKQEVLDEQLQQQKKLISKLEAGRLTLTKEEKEELMALIKTLQIGIEKLKTDLQDKTSKSSLTIAPKSKEETQREMLDAELELYNKEQEGGDTVALQKKINDLRAKARALGVPYRGRGGGFRGSSRGYPPRGRGARQAARLSRTVDRRPTRIRVTGFPVARLPEILPHFSQFGTITEYESDPITPSMILNFESRKFAEMALTNGKVFGEIALETMWAHAAEQGNMDGSQPGGSNGDANQEPLENGASIEDDELGDILANEILLTYEEEDDDEETARSWRR